MYPVSDAYINAIENTNPEWAVSVILYNFYNFPEETFWAYGGDMRDGQIMNGITIESQMVSGGANENMIDIGAVPAKKMTLTLIDENSDLHKYANRRLAVYVYITIETEQGEKIQQQIPMGVFYVDSSSLSRNGNQISIVAYDSMLSFQYALTEEQRASLKGRYATEAASFLASYSDCGFDQDLSALPNGNIPLNFDSAQVVTGRDALMWIAQIMGCFARIDRHNNLEFVPIKCDWTYFDEEQTLGTINAVRNIPGAQRYDELKFTDDRIHIVGVAMERDDGKLVTRGFEGLFDDANITITLEKNPIISGCGKSLESILDAILEQLCTVYFYAFKTVIRNDPSLDAGDVIRLQGGVINGTNRNNDLIGFITHSTWNYHGRQTITNVGQVPIVYRDAPAAAVAALSAENGIAPLAEMRAADTGFQVAPVPQSQKAAKGGSTSDRLISPDGKWTLRLNNGDSEGYDEAWVGLFDENGWYQGAAKVLDLFSAGSLANAITSLSNRLKNLEASVVALEQSVAKGSDHLTASNGNILKFMPVTNGTGGQLRIYTPKQTAELFSLHASDGIITLNSGQTNGSQVSVTFSGDANGVSETIKNAPISSTRDISIQNTGIREEITYKNGAQVTYVWKNDK